MSTAPRATAPRATAPQATNGNGHAPVARTATAERTVRDVEGVVRVSLPDRSLVMDAAAIKSNFAMSYADAFAAATAVQLDAALWTGDPELLIAGAPWHPFDPSA